ncbi:MAG TPA: chromate efflux transporter [Actinospica sp.]|nr:chromate efflux transporter [Actinospica sp.]
MIVREWTRIGCTGFGGPPAHIALLRRLCVTRRAWIPADDFEQAIAVTNLLPGPASTQLAIYCAWRLRGRPGAVLGGICFIVPGLVLILALSALFLASHPPLWVAGAAAGAGAAVPAVAVHAAYGLAPASRRHAGKARAARIRWLCYLAVGALGAVLLGPYLVLVLLGCALVEMYARTGRPRPGTGRRPAMSVPAALPLAGATGGLLALAWVALKVGALSYGGGFVIIPLMQHDAVHTYHWMTAAQFLDAVALGQVTPGPVVQTVAVVGYAAAGIGGGLLAATIAFTPSFCFVLLGARHFERLRGNDRAQAFLSGAGPAAIGGIAGAALPLGLSLAHLWQVGVLAAAVLVLFVARRGVVPALLGAGALGVIAALAGAAVN